MSKLIWESTGIISSSTPEAKFRVKMNDGTNMSDSDEGIGFINVVNGVYGINVGYFRYSLGFGHLGYNYDEFWNAASLQYEGEVESYGGGIGIVDNLRLNSLPYAHGVYNQNISGYVNVTNVAWEIENYSAIVTLNINGGHYSYWGSEINASTGNSNWDYPNGYLGIEWGAAPFVNTYAHEGNPNYERRIPQEDIDGYNILVHFKLDFTTDTNTYSIECVDTSTSAITGSKYAFAPVHFANLPYNFTVGITQLNKPEYINEGEFAPISLELTSFGYGGEFSVYLLDNQSIDSVNEAIGDDLADWYGEIGEDVVAQYGLLDYNNQKIFNDTIELNETKSYQITYLAGNVDSGQTDNMSIFVKFNTPDWNLYGADPSDPQQQWSLLNLQNTENFYSYSDNISIPIIDVNEEHIEEYDPSINLITQPVDIIHHLMSEELGFDKDNYSNSSKAYSRDNHVGWEFAFSLNKEKNAKEIIKEISQSCKSIPTLKNNRLEFITIKDTYDGRESINTIKARDVLKYNFTRTELDDVKTQVQIKYNKDYGLDTYQSITDKIAVDYGSYVFTDTYGEYKDSEGSYFVHNYYGLKIANGEIDHVDTFLELENDYIRDEYTATQLAKHLLFWNMNQHNIVTLTMPITYYAYEIGDLIDFDEMLDGRKVCGEKYVLDSIDDMPIRCGQYILPLFMITEVKRSLNNVEIKAIQLHHMTDDVNLQYDVDGDGTIQNDEIYDQITVTQAEAVNNLGDVNGDGSIDVQDLVMMVSHIILNSTLTGFALRNADFNQDGSVDILDLVSMIDRILDE